MDGNAGVPCIVQLVEQGTVPGVMLSCVRLGILRQVVPRAVYPILPKYTREPFMKRQPSPQDP